VTAAELIEYLKGLDPGTKIYVFGYEGGMHEASPEEMDVIHKPNDAWYYGDYYQVSWDEHYEKFVYDGSCEITEEDKPKVHKGVCL
jgi:hypothetical protein